MPAVTLGTLLGMPLLPKSRSRRALERLNRLEEQMRGMRKDLSSRIDDLEVLGADREVAALAAERVRSGAAERTEDGAEALQGLGIDLP